MIDNEENRTDKLLMTVVEEKRDNTLYTVAEVARMMKLHPQTLKTWRMYGKGPPFVKIGKRIGYRHVDVIQFIQSRICHNNREAEALEEAGL